MLCLLTKLNLKTIGASYTNQLATSIQEKDTCSNQYILLQVAKVNNSKPNAFTAASLKRLMKAKKGGSKIKSTITFNSKLKMKKVLACPTQPNKSK